MRLKCRRLMIIRAPGFAAIVLGMALATTRSCPAQATRPADAVAEQVRQAVLRLSDDDPKVRETGEIQLRNLPAEAYPIIRDRYKAEDLDPAAQPAMESAAKTLAARYNASKARRESLEWEKRELLAAYEKAEAKTGEKTSPPGGLPGKPSAKPWDADAREALALVPGLRLSPDDWLVAVRRLDLLRSAIDAGCDDPVVWASYAACDLEAIASAGPLPTNPIAPPKLGDGAPSTDVSAQQADARCAAPLRKAAADLAGGSDLSPWVQCFILCAWLDFESATGADRSESPRTRSAIHARLPDALWDCPAEARVQLALKLYELEKRANPRHDGRGVIDAIYAPYAKAEPGGAGPLVFKAIVMRDAAADWLAQNPPTEDDPPGTPAGYTARLQAAVEALDAAWKAGPTNARVPAAAIPIKQLAGASREEIDTWFKRAMDADPDNLDACKAMRGYLVARAADGNSDPDQQLLEFGHQCRLGSNFRGRIAFMLVQAHVALAAKAPNAHEYFSRPAVWDELRDTYDACLRAFPESVTDRAAYAKLAVAFGDYDTADFQFSQIGGHDDAGAWGVWGGRRAYDYYRMESARKATLVRSGGSPDGRAAPAVEAELAEALGEAARAEVRSPESEAPLRRVSARFPEVKVGTERGKALWSKLALNAAGKGVDCIRVRTPAGQAPEMRWSFCYPNGRVSGWQILRADGKPMNGFVLYSSFNPNSFEGVKGPGDGLRHTGVVQQLAASDLEPDTEYLIAFRFTGREPAVMTFAVNFLPAKNPRAEPEELGSDMGFKAR